MELKERDVLEEVIKSADIIFGAAFSAYLGVSLATRGLDGGEIYMLPITLLGITFGIANANASLAEPDGVRQRISGMYYAAIGFGCSTGAIAGLTPQYSALLSILAGWYLVFILVHIFDLLRNRQND